MAVAWALSRLRTLLIVIKFVVVSDCQSLVYLNAWKTKNTQVSRGMSELSEFDLKIRHRRCECMQDMDALSRAPVGEHCIEHVSEVVTEINSNEDEILVFQRSDPRLMQLISFLKKRECERSKEEKLRIHDFVLRDGILYKKVMRDEKEI